MATVADIIRMKGNDVYWVAPDATLSGTLKEMAKRNVGAVLVLDEHKICGIFSERDFARQVVEQKDLAIDTTIRELMTQPVLYVTPETSLDECMGIMTARRFRHLPVIDDGQLVGLISIGDVVKQLLLEKNTTIESLEHYIWIHMI
ncbi:MAG TPA: CBS domain-containing protein [Chloroflexi bacterium]|jgi:CBS domain-containing protein|nr:CBS domain-containing protein [Chloroflexota bacterium]HPO57320.1 CBS domain-containing protein [Anaerolineaceae bacterium]